MQPSALRGCLRGIVPILLCPYDDDAVDLDGLRENVAHLADFAGGRDVVFVTNGSNTEFYANSEAEQRAVIEATLEESGDVPVLAGTGRPSTRATVEMTRYAADAGADGALVVLPYYRQPAREELYEHYRTVCDAVDIGIVLYNNPFVSGAWADPGLIARLSSIDNLVGVKENAAAGPQWAALFRAIDPEDVSMICGLGEEMYPAAAAYGAAGTVSVIANFAPHLVYDLYEAVDGGDRAAFEETFERFTPLFEAIGETLERREGVSILPPTQRGHPVYTAIGKYGLDYVGRNGGPVRAPMSNLADEEKERLDAAFEAAGLD